MNADRFTPGTWYLEGWKEMGEHSTRGQPGEIAPYNRKVSKAEAELSPVAVFFSCFYGREDFSNISFEDGIVDGSLNQRAVDDIGAHIVPASGTYASDRFEVAFLFTGFGMKIRQVVTGKLIEPAN